MIKQMNDSQIASLIEHLGLKQEDIIITDPKAEILSGMAQMTKDEIHSVIKAVDPSQFIIIDSESLLGKEDKNVGNKNICRNRKKIFQTCIEDIKK